MTIVLRYLFTILLIITVAIQTFSKWMVIAAFEINKDYIAKNLCINRAKPSNCCKGKCFLKKKLDGDEDSPQSSGKILHLDSQLQLFLHKIVPIALAPPLLKLHYNSFYLAGKSQEFSPSFFEPPQELSA